MKRLMIASLLAAASPLAAAETLSCTLYVSQSPASAMSHRYEIRQLSAQLHAERAVGHCVFADGRVADKQFVVVQHIEQGGAIGAIQGFSVYTLGAEDALSLRFDGGWDSGGFVGEYTVTGGSGRFAGASGSGRFTSNGEQLAHNSVFDVTIDVELAQ